MSHAGSGVTATRDELSRDPYPTYRRLRDEGACVWLEAAGRYVVPRWEDVVALDDRKEITAREDPSLMTRAMGRTMLRVDGDEHARLRAPAQSPLRFRGFADRWGDMFEREADALLRPLRDRGHMDVLGDFAGPFAARTLKLLLGLDTAGDADLEFASQAFIDGIGNYGDDRDTWERCERGNRLVDDAIDAAWDTAEDGTVLRALVDAGTLSEDEIRANVKLFISGGLNEPRDVIATALHALLADPEQEALVREDAENLGEGDRGEPALDLPDRDVPARRAGGHRARRGGARGRDADRRAHRVGQPRRAPLGGPRPLRPDARDHPAPGVLARASRLSRRVRRAPAGGARRAAGAARPAGHPPRGRRRALPRVGVPRPGAAGRGLDRLTWTA